MSATVSVDAYDVSPFTTCPSTNYKNPVCEGVSIEYNTLDVICCSFHLLRVDVILLHEESPKAVGATFMALSSQRSEAARLGPASACTGLEAHMAALQFSPR